MSPRCAGWLLTVVLLAQPSRAAADDNEAERLFKEGRAAMLAGDFATACPKLAESQRLEPHTGTLLNLAACHEREGKVASAWVEYQKALTAARTEGQADKARLAEQRIPALEPRVPWLRLMVGAREDIRVTLDGAEIARAALGTDMPVDPGMHVVGGGDGEQRIDLREGERRTITVADAHTPEPKPEHIVVDPPSNKHEDPPLERGRWVFHFGAMLGAGFGRMDYPRAINGGVSTLVPTDPRIDQTPRRCGDQCTFSSVRASGAGLGVHLYAGYAFTESVNAGVRLLGMLSSDVTTVGFGPAIVFQSGDRLQVGAFALFGDGTMIGKAYSSPPSGYSFRQQALEETQGSLGGGLGLGVSAAFRLYQVSARSELTLDVMPHFLSGSGGHTIVLPIGLGFRYQ